MSAGLSLDGVPRAFMTPTEAARRAWAKHGASRSAYGMRKEPEPRDATGFFRPHPSRQKNAGAGLSSPPLESPQNSRAVEAHEGAGDRAAALEPYPPSPRGWRRRARAQGPSMVRSVHQTEPSAAPDHRNDSTNWRTA